MPSIEHSVRDQNVIEHMLSYCDQLQGTLQEIEYDQNRFLASHTYQNAAAMCILQLGELAKQLSDGFLTQYPEIPWRIMARTRDHYAHHYGDMDFSLVWETAIRDVPVIQNFCSEFLADK